MRRPVGHRFRAFAGVVACVLLSAAPLAAQEIAVPARIQFPILAKILSFDRNMEGRGGGEIVVGILYQSRFRTSEVVREGMLTAIRDGNVKSIMNQSVRPVLIDVQLLSDLRSAIAASGADVLYVAPLRSIGVDTVCGVSRALKIISMTGVPEYVERGVAVGIGLSDERPQILINLRSAQEEGADFSSQLLRVAKVVP